MAVCGASIPIKLCSDLPLFVYSSDHRGADMQNFALAVQQTGYFIAQLSKIFNRKFHLIQQRSR